MVPPASHKVSRVSWYSGYCWIQYIFPYTALTLFGPLFQNGSGNISYSYCSPLPRSARTTVWALTISLAATFAITVVFFSSGYLDVSVHRVCLPFGWCDMTRTGLPHSDIRGSRPICGSPRLFAAYRVLLRLLTPRHPPYAFRSLTFPRFSSCVSPQGIISDVLGFRESLIHSAAHLVASFSPCLRQQILHIAPLCVGLLP